MSALSEKNTTLWADLANVVQAGHHYRNAPIVEAILEVRVIPATDLRVEQLASVVVAPDFGEPQAQFNVTAEMEVSDADVVSHATKEQVGFAFVRQDNQRVVRAHLDRFSFSWLKPYQDWDAFSAEALDRWATYATIAGPEEVTRVAVRFVNKIDVNKPSVEVKDYLRTSIDISPYLPQAMMNFFVQVDIPLERHNAVARVLSTLVQPDMPGHTSLILDIDTWRAGALDLRDDGGREALVECLDVLRKAKNYVFEACITDATRGLIS